jgi:hypothetical protein
VRSVAVARRLCWLVSYLKSSVFFLTLPVLKARWRHLIRHSRFFHGLPVVTCKTYIINLILHCYVYDGAGFSSSFGTSAIPGSSFVAEIAL